MTRRTTQQYVLYVVALKAHPGVIKVGRTTNWKSRRKYYDTWNFARWDAMRESVVYTLTEEHVDLPGLEKALVDALAYGHARHFGSEWFKAEVSAACDIVEHMLAAVAVSYEKTHAVYDQPPAKAE